MAKRERKGRTWECWAHVPYSYGGREVLHVADSNTVGVGGSAAWFKVTVTEIVPKAKKASKRKDRK